MVGWVSGCSDVLLDESAEAKRELVDELGFQGVSGCSAAQHIEL